MAMLLSYYLLFLIGLLIIFAFLYFAILANQPTSPGLDVFNLRYGNLPNFNWQPPTSSTCSTYTFIDSYPTTDFNTIQNMTPNNNLTNPEGCLDSDQLSLQLVTRTCGVENSSDPTCVGYDGKVYQRGETETFYDYCNIGYCPDSIIGALAFNFDYTPNDVNGGFTNARCLTYESYDDFLPLEVCSPQHAGQFFRITRGDVEGISFKNVPSGQYMKIQERNTGLCVFPDYNGVDSLLKLDHCGNLANGFVWLLAPPIISNLGPFSSVSPQQILYNPNPSSALTSKTFMAYVTQNNALAIFGRNPYAQLEVFSTDINNVSPEGVGYNSQILDKRIYPIMSGNYETSPIVPKRPERVDGTLINFPYYQWEPFSGS